MKLTDLEIRNFRSIKSQEENDRIQLRGLDCLVGENNAGKTNILSAIKFLLAREDKENNAELHWNLDNQNTVEVRGYFDITEGDLSQISDDEKRKACRDSLIDRGKYDGKLGICRIQNSDGSPEMRLLAFRPKDQRLSIEELIQYRDTRWDDKKDPEKSFTEENYVTAMREEYREVAELIPEQKHSQKGIWKDKLLEYIESDPEEVDFVLRPTRFESGTKLAITEKLLPEVITIPAVREVSSAVQRGGEFGNIIKQIQAEIQEELDEQLQAKTSGFQPGEHDKIEQIQEQISGYLNKTFSNQSVKIQFPKLSTEYLFQNADIKIQEDHLDDLSKENVGEGVKRTVIFSLLQTLADLRMGNVTVGDTEPESRSSPFLILFEEAELFLHPSLQKRLLSVLSDLSADDSQVIFSTHSPMMIQNEPLDTINIVRKDLNQGSEVTQFHRVLNNFSSSEAEKSRLTQMERISSYIFSDRVVLVEGVSDRIFMRKVAPHLNDDWDFDNESIPLLDVGGKRDVRIFYQFLKRLDIDAFCIFDLDAIQDEIPGLVEGSELSGTVSEFQSTVNDSVSPQYSEEDLEMKISTMPWNGTDREGAFEHIEQMATNIRDGSSLTDEDAEVLEKLLAKTQKTEAGKDDFAKSEFRNQRMEIVRQLLDRRVLLLSGEIEDYFPRNSGSGGKHMNALLYDPEEDATSSDPTDRFTTIDDTTDVELFLGRVFSS